MFAPTTQPDHSFARAPSAGQPGAGPLPEAAGCRSASAGAASLAAVLGRFQGAHPAAFHAGQPPLKIGVHLDLFSAHPDLSRAAIRRALYAWTHRRHYLANLARRMPRVALDGAVLEAPTPGQAIAAGEALAPRESRVFSGGGSPAQAAYARAVRIRRSALPGDDLGGEALASVLALLEHHPRARAKKRGLVGVRVVDFQGTNALAGVYDDGRVEPFSLRKCREGALSAVRRGDRSCRESREDGAVIDFAAVREGLALR